MPWIEVSIRVPRDEAEAAEQALEALGALAVTLQDDADVPVLEPGPGETPLWPTLQVRGLFEADADRERITVGLQGLAAVRRPDELDFRAVDDRDWTRAWMDRFRPMRFGRRLWIVPGGMDAPEDPGSTVVRLDPGLAFGTGTHPTTALCLEWLDGHDVRGQCVVDYGCGSGILGVAAALSGASRVVCIDNDPQALVATVQNARRNGVAGRIVCQPPESCPPVRASVVLANILADALIALAGRLLDLLEEGGWLVLSGILEDQAERVCDAYRPGLADLSVQARDGWVRIQGVRR